MLEVGWSEILVIAIVMIVVVGPKDLPKMLRTFASFAKKARGMANEFQSQFSDAMRDAELDDVRKTIADVRSLNPKNALKEAFDPIRKAGEDVKREMQSIKTETQNSISGAAAAPVTAAPLPVVEPVTIVTPTPSVVLPNVMPSEFAPVIVKAKAKVKKVTDAKTEPTKKPKVIKQVAKKAEAKA